MPDLFSYMVEDENFHFKYARGTPSLRGREFHSYHEMVLFLNGKAQLISRDIQLTLVPGTSVLIPREQFHQFVVTEEESYQRCILGFRETPALQQLMQNVMQEVTVIQHPPARMLSVFASLMEMTRSTLTEAEKRLMLPAAVTQLLAEQKMSRLNPIREPGSLSEITRSAVHYIDTHLTEKLELKGLAAHFNTSVSSLSHHFRQELNISIYHYIVKKRLSVARGYLERGFSVGDAALFSGFRDYAGFFRLYKKYYGTPPRGT